jgi:hypothetical protein
MVEQGIHEYLHALATLELAIEFDDSSKYLRNVAIRIANNAEHKQARMLCLGIHKTKLPKATIRKLVRQMRVAYKGHGINWTELHA